MTKITPLHNTCVFVCSPTNVFRYVLCVCSKWWMLCWRSSVRESPWIYTWLRSRRCSTRQTWTPGL